MSLHLRILLLIAAVNVGVLILVVWLGLKTADTAPVGPQALVEAWNVAEDPDLDQTTWRSVRGVIRLRPDGKPLVLQIETSSTMVGPNRMYEMIAEQWTEFRVIFDMPIDCDKVGIYVELKDTPAPARIWFDDFRFYEGVAAEIDIKPETFNVKSKGEFTAFIDLPEG